jgi:2-dehydro-3-deoxygluconokinase
VELVSRARQPVGKKRVTEKRIVCFGEMLIRLTAPSCELLLQSPRLDVCCGGAETNVAVSLARLGAPASLVSVLPDNAIGRAALDEVRKYGVDTRGVRFTPGRMGLYFLTPGAVLRPAEIIYDRAGSAFAEADPELIDWEQELEGAGLLHLSGVTPALGARGSAAALRAARAAKAKGVPVSFDGNYRGKLWATWNGDGPGVLRALLDCAEIAFVDDRDIALALGAKFETGDPATRRADAAAAAFAAFPGLGRIASTFRLAHQVDHHELSATMFTRGHELRTRAVPLVGIVDRIGGGDAFAAGVLHGLRSGTADQTALDFGLAAACLKHAIPGDFNLATEADVHNFLAQDSLDVRR